MGMKMDRKLLGMVLGAVGVGLLIYAVWGKGRPRYPPAKVPVPV